jgi:hypothetical protein
MTIAEKLQAIANNEQAVYNAGYEKGKAEGGNTETAYNEGFEAGKQAEYDRFWDNYQQNGTRLHYDNAFAGRGWNDELFKPKYDITPTVATNLFSNNNIVDVTSALQRAGVKINWDRLHSFSYIIQGNNTMERFPVIDLSKNAVTSLNYFISGNEKLKVVEAVILKDDGSQTFTNYSFGTNPSLEEIRFGGVIGQNGFNVQWSTKLSKESIKSIISALSTATSGLSITLSKTAVNTAFAMTDDNPSEEWERIRGERGNWTINLV